MNKIIMSNKNGKFAEFDSESFGYVLGTWAKMSMELGYKDFLEAETNLNLLINQDPRPLLIILFSFKFSCNLYYFVYFSNSIPSKHLKELIAGMRRFILEQKDENTDQSIWTNEYADHFENEIYAFTLILHNTFSNNENDLSIIGREVINRICQSYNTEIDTQFIMFKMTQELIYTKISISTFEYAKENLNIEYIQDKNEESPFGNVVRNEFNHEDGRLIINVFREKFEENGGQRWSTTYDWDDLIYSSAYEIMKNPSEEDIRNRLDAAGLFQHYIDSVIQEAHSLLKKSDPVLSQIIDYENKYANELDDFKPDWKSASINTKFAIFSDHQKHLKKLEKSITQSKPTLTHIEKDKAMPFSDMLLYFFGTIAAFLFLGGLLGIFN